MGDKGNKILTFAIHDLTSTQNNQAENETVNLGTRRVPKPANMNIELIGKI